MTTQLRGSWSLDVGEKSKSLSSLPSPDGKKQIDVKQGNFGDLNAGLHTLRQHINDVLTQWKDAIGDENHGKGNIPHTADQQEEDEGQDSDDEEN